MVHPPLDPMAAVWQDQMQEVWEGLGQEQQQRTGLGQELCLFRTNIQDQMSSFQAFVQQKEAQREGQIAELARRMESLTTAGAAAEPHTEHPSADAETFRILQGRLGALENHVMTGIPPPFPGQCT